ncbi:ROK family protein [Peribacillus sp. NPDC076916]|uniref:ROK family protein n=1 Tax=Peribacillus sp. NPDC076916 TaxID=3390608 RepID=UPI003D020988
MAYLSIDIGGTFIKFALIDEQQQLIHQQKTATKENLDHAILKQVEEIVINAMSRYTISGIGISTAGIVDRDKGRIIYAGPTIKNYRGTNFKKYISDTFHLPVHVENDVNAALLGERWKGAAMNDQDVFCITLGTGIGGAYYHEGLMVGSYHQANSVGYLLYDSETETNFEMKASTSALNARIQSELGDDLTAKQVFDRAKQGDNTCNTVIASWAREVAKGLAQIILIVDPSSIIIGGGISAQGPFLLKYIQQFIPQYLPINFMKTKIKVAKLGNDAALYGAVYPFFREESTC